jgi:hypothetical protein
MHISRAQQVLAIAALGLLISFGTSGPAYSDGDESCAGMGDVFELDVPGTYTAFALRPSGSSILTQVRGGHGEILATSHPTAAASAADLVSGDRFDVARQVSEVESSVMIHVQNVDTPYELFVVRVDGTNEFSDERLRPVVERVVNKSGSCLIGDLRVTFKIHTGAMYSEIGKSHVFVVDSPTPNR